MVVLGHYGDYEKAWHAAGELNEAGIRTALPNYPDNLRFGYGVDRRFRGMHGVVDLFVPEADADRARAILAEVEPLVDAPPPPGFRDEDGDMPEWLAAQRAAAERNQRTWGRDVLIFFSVLTAVVLTVAVIGIYSMLR